MTIQCMEHVGIAVDDIDAVVASLRTRGGELVGEVESYEDSYRLCHVRGPEGIIVELAEQIAEGSGRPPRPTTSPDDVAEALWTDDVDRRAFQTRLGMP